MGFFDQLRSRTQEMSGQLKTRAGQFKTKEFANASMAMCALIAAADGTIDAAERQRTEGVITSNDILSIFPPDELRQKFAFYADRLVRDFEFGKVEAVATIAKLKSKPDHARAVIQIGIIIGGADGNFDDNEKKAVREACFAVGIAPTEFDL